MILKERMTECLRLGCNSELHHHGRIILYFPIALAEWGTIFKRVWMKTGETVFVVIISLDDVGGHSERTLCF